MARDQCAYFTPPVIVDFDSTIIFPSHRALLSSSTFTGVWWHASPGGFLSAQKEGIFKNFFIVRLLIGLTLNPEGLFNRMYLSTSGLISRTLLI